MSNNTVRRARFAAAALAPLFALAGPAVAMAASVPVSADAGQNYSNTQTTTTRDGVETVNTTSCMGPDGQVSYERTSTRATANGKVASTTTSGSGICQSDAARADQTAPMAVKAGPSSNPFGGRSSEAPLVVINNPMGR